MPDIISVVGGGWSFRDVATRPLPGLVIGVNDSAVHLDRCDIALTMDRLWAEYRAGELQRRGLRSFVRRSAMKNLSPWPNLTVFDCDNESTEMSDVAGILNGTNSGMCALNLAYQLRPKRIFLFGFDMSRGPAGEPYWFANYPWAPAGATPNGRYAAWAKQFHPVAEACRRVGIEVLNVSPLSAVEAFRRIAPAEMEAYA